MKKQYQYLSMFLVTLLFIIALSSTAQKQFTHTATKENNNCNGNCTLLDIAELNDNPAAIIWVTPILENEVNLNPHPIGVYFVRKQWHIFNLDQTSIPAGAKFNVNYVASSDSRFFQYSIARENIQEDGSSLIDHPSLNNNPNVKFSFFQSWLPELRGGLYNRDEVSMQFNNETGKWYVSNNNEKPLWAMVTYNILIFDEEPDMNWPLITKDPITKKTPAKDPVNTETPLDIKDPVAKKTIPPVYDFSNVHICIEKVSNKSLPAKTVISQPVIPKINPNGELEPVSTITQPLSGVTNLMWSAGETISVGFYSDETFVVTNKIKQYVKEWETYANIKFVFINDVSKAMVKVGFEKNGTSWSWLGRNVLVNSSNEKTMNFGWLDDLTDATEFRRIVLHEFGHALGFIHEHQTPLAGIPWDKEKVYSYFGGTPNNWSRATVDNYVFARYSQATTNSSTYDKLSIMHYFFPKELTTDESIFSWNTNLSAVDKTFARQVYPFPPAPPTSTGVLLTGDDCDEIEFTVEYNVVHSSEVEFILHPGYDHHNALVNWWKMIGIPQKSGVVAALELYKTIKIPVIMIEKNKPITFGKAKVLGVHTGLGFTWAPWPAIVGGCRVKFVWRRDSCN